MPKGESYINLVYVRQDRVRGNNQRNLLFCHNNYWHTVVPHHNRSDSGSTKQEDVTRSAKASFQEPQKLQITKVLFWDLQQIWPFELWLTERETNTEMSWATEDWTLGLSGHVAQKVKELRVLQERLSRENKQKQLQIDNICTSLEKQNAKVKAATCPWCCSHKM